MPAAPQLLVKYVEDVAVVTVTESTVIEPQHVEQIRKSLFDMLEAENRTRIILDLSKVTHLSSSALGVLIPLRQRAQELKGEIILCGVRPEVRRIFKLTRLDRQFTFCNEESDALAKLGVSLT